MLFRRIPMFLISILAINTVFAFNISNPTPFNVQAATKCPEGQVVSVSFKEWLPFGVVKFEIDNTGAKYVQLKGFEIHWIQRAPSVLTLNQVTVGGTGPSDLSGKIIWQSGSPAEDANPPTIASTEPSESEGNWLDDFVFPPNSITPIYLDFDGTAPTLPIAFGATPSDFNGTWFDTICIDRNRPPRADVRGVDENGVTMPENVSVTIMTDTLGSMVFVLLDGTRSRDPDGMIVRYLWTIAGITYADGDITAAGRVTLQLGPGTHIVVLTVYDNGDATDEVEIIVTINVPTPTSYTVTTTDDSNDGVCDSQCSLREAIILSNSTSGVQTILFNIAGTPPYTIHLTSALPTITDPVIIDGWSESDFAGAPIIELDGSLLSNGNGLTITAGNSTVRGLVLPGISIQANGGNTIQGNFIGTNAAGNATVENGYGIWIDNTSNNIIGGANTQARNIISGKGSVNIYLDGSGAANNVVAGNYIGTNGAGTSGLYPNSNGIWISGPENTIGPGNLISGNSFGIQLFSAGSIGNVIKENYIGTNAAGTASIGNEYGITIIADVNNPANSPSETSILNNLISGNNSWGISIDGTGNIVQGNYIGTDFTGTVDLGNGMAGIFAGGSNSIIGGTTAGTGNFIAFNGDWGIWIGQSYSTITILGNSIFSNKPTHSSTFGLGIDLESAEIPSPNSGITPNDAGDGDEGANNLQNFPVLTSVSATSSAITIKGRLNSAANRTYRIEFFANDTCDPSGYGEGQIFIGATNITTNGSGNANFNVEYSFAATVGQYLTSTATDPTGNTSEFSRCRAIVPGSSTNDVPERNAFPTTDVTLTWSSISWATGYRVEIATDSRFTNIHHQIDIPVGQLTYDWIAPNSGKYYWHVRAKDADNIWRTWSNIESFIVMP